MQVKITGTENMRIIYDGIKTNEIIKNLTRNIKQDNYSKINFLISFLTSLYFGYKLPTTFQNLSE